MFGDVVMNIENKNFEEVLTRIKKKQKIKTDDKLTVNDLKYLIS